MKATRTAAGVALLAASSLLAQSPPPQPPAGAFQPPSPAASPASSPAGAPPGPAVNTAPATAPPAQPFESWRFNARERTHRGLAAWRNEKPAEAVEALDTAARLRPEDPLATYNSGTAHLGAGLGDADSILERSLARAPSELAADAHFNLGNARLAAQNSGGAIDAFKETLRRAPGHAGARRNLELAQRLLEQQKKEQQQQQQQDPQNGGDKGEQQKSESDPDAENESQEKPPESSREGESDNEQKPQDGQGAPQSGNGGERERPLPQFKDQKDMTAEQAAAILQAVDNLEREKRREEAKQRARAKSTVEKDW